MNRVALFTSAWIETLCLSGWLIVLGVALFTSAWIETVGFMLKEGQLAESKLPFIYMESQQSTELEEKK